jgi:hypothetical protein
VIETSDVAQQTQALAGPPKFLQPLLRSLQAARRDRSEVIDLPRNQPNGLTVAGVLRRLPGSADPREASLEVARRRIEQPLNRVLRRTGNLQIARHVVHKEVLKDVGTSVAPPRFAVLFDLLDQLRVVSSPLILREQVFVRVHKRE